MEVGLVEKRTIEVYERLRSEKKKDQEAAAIELPAFWPALFAMGGNSPEAHELTHLKGEFDALRENSIYKECEIDVLMPNDTRFVEHEQQIREIRAERNRKCPRKMVTIGHCRKAWELANPEKAAILKNAD